MNVLVIEGDEPIALALANGLRRAGFVAESVGCAAALNALPSEFILLDLRLADRDGVELFHSLGKVTGVDRGVIRWSPATTTPAPCRAS